MFLQTLRLSFLVSNFNCSIKYSFFWAQRYEYFMVLFNNDNKISNNLSFLVFTCFAQLMLSAAVYFSWKLA